MRLIDADELLKQYDKEHEGPPGRARELIENAPTVKDSVKVIRCKDCHYYIYSRVLDKRVCENVLGMGCCTVTENDYCSAAMRKIDTDHFIAEMEKRYPDLKENIDTAKAYVQRTVESKVIMCKDCVHRPIINDPRAIGGFGLQFPDFKCPCRCDDEYYSWMPNDNWFCGNGEKEE